MPLQGVDIVDKNDLLTYKEMYRLIRVLSELGVDKVRFTGGEPFVRREFMNFLNSLTFNKNLKSINITSNGVLIEKHISELETLGINNINLSIDSLKAETFNKITNRQTFDAVYRSLLLLQKSPINLKLNVVILPDVNTDEIIDFIELTKSSNLAVRFIEEMPFNGKGIRKTSEVWDVNAILKHVQHHYKKLINLPHQKSSTSNNYKIEGYQGTFGIIPAFTRSICHDCNRIRITATGLFKNCLFDDGVFNVRDFIRKGASDDDLKKLFIETVGKKPQNGFVAEASRNNKISESMSTIGG
jgi:cyclic pyranopterin phosphate synthase